MAKNHYFVQQPPEKQLGSSYKECKNCGKPFVGGHGNRRYCSEECYKEAAAVIKHEWYLSHKEVYHERRTKRNREKGIMPVEEFRLHSSLRQVRNMFIKQHLIYKELMTFQIINETGSNKINMYGNRKKSIPARCELIISKLKEWNLYTEQIDVMEKEDLDFDQEYKKRLL